MKSIVFVLIFVIVMTIVGCYVIPTRMVSIPNLTLSIPFGDTTVTVLQAALQDTAHMELSSNGDTVYAKTKTRYRENVNSFIAGSLRISINIEELLPADVIDLDSTYFTSYIDRIINHLMIMGTFNDTARGRVKHLIRNRNYDTIYTTVLSLEIPSGVYTSDNPFVYDLIVDSFPAGDYRHDIDVIIDTADYHIDRVESYTKMPLAMHLRGDRVVIYMRDQGLISPPDSTPLDLINSIFLNLRIVNRIPMGSRLIFALYNKPGTRVLLDTFEIPLPLVDSNGHTIGQEAIYDFTLSLDTTLYDIFAYDSVHYKARVEVPVAINENGDTVEGVFVRPNDYMRVSGYIIINFDLDNNKLSDSNKIFK